MRCDMHQCADQWIAECKRVLSQFCCFRAVDSLILRADFFVSSCARFTSSGEKYTYKY